MTTADPASLTTQAHEFFDRYAVALLARDERTLAHMYAVPALILFPGQPVVVTDARQTDEFFASAWDQYEGVVQLDKEVTILAQAPWSVCYQLVGGTDGLRIAVLTPLDLDLSTRRGRASSSP